MMLQPGIQPSNFTGLLTHGGITCASGGKHARADASSAARKEADYLTALAIMRPRVLDYDVHSCSSYSASYLPENIKTNNPHDQSSRWSSGSNNQMQYIMIKLKTMAIAHTITFGKYHKVHVCNLKEFKVFGGLTTSNMTELLHTGLRNDNEPETFLLKHKTNAVVFPCRYIKIVPLMAWGANFNFSIWHVQLKGIPDPVLVQETYLQYVSFRETESVRLCLKHFRQRQLMDAFKALQERTNIKLEDPLLSNLHQELVIKGNFKRAEELITEASEQGFFDAYIQSFNYKPIWRRLGPHNQRQGLHHHHHSHHTHVEESPRHRGGHQMCIDTQGRYVYLMGGWDGSRDLSDFWAYHIPSETWILISADTSLQGGPSARSCHKVCYSPQHKAIFMLGKYVDPENRSKTDLSAEFWRFDIDPSSPPFGRWTKISGNTATLNGPELIYDHQMCLDPVSQTLYVFGGKVVHLDKNVQHYSGLYSYHIPSGVWKLLRADGHPPPKQDNGTILRSRIGHSMLYDDMTRSLVIFAGQMNKDYLSDFYVYDIAADRVIEVCKDYNKQGGPEAGFTQRATLSSRRREIYVLSGLVKDRALGAETVKNSFWVFKLPGVDQMSAIRDVQWALANSKSPDSIGSLKNILNHGRSFSDHMEQGTDKDEDPSRLHLSRRKMSNGENHGRQETRSNSRKLSSRQSTSFGSSPSLISDASTDVGQYPAHSIQTRSSSSGRKMCLRSGSSSQSSVMFAPYAPLSRSGESHSCATHPSNHEAPNSREGAVPGTCSARPSGTPSPSRQYGIGLNGYTQPLRTGDSTSITTEPMSLSYVLSDQGSWQKSFQNTCSESTNGTSDTEPVPRYAHQLVYDDVNEVQYLFGGNPGEQGNMSKRLDDFWELRLYRPKPEEIVRKAKYLLRTQQFKELCQNPEASTLTSTTVLPTQDNGSSTVDRNVTESATTKSHGQRRGIAGGPIQRGTQEHHDHSCRALKFLQTELSCVVDQSNKAESDSFKALIRGLLMGAFSPSAGTAVSFSTSPMHKPSFTSSNARIIPGTTMAGNVQRTTVLLASSPITSPTMNSSPFLLFNDSDSNRASSVRPFLTSPKCCSTEAPIFDANGGCSVHGNEEPHIQDSPMYQCVSRPRQCKSTRQDFDSSELDRNGERIGGDGGHCSNVVKNNKADGYEDYRLQDNEDPDVEMESEDQDELSETLYHERTQLYEMLLEFFTDEVKQPKSDLTNLVKVG